MNYLLEVNPETCIVIVGPLVSRLCLSVVPNSLKLTYMSLMLAGLDMVRVHERGQLEELFQGKFNVATEELCKILKEQGDLEKWLSTCSDLQPSSLTKSQPPLLQLLLQMQSRGCRLIYTHYDNILDAVAGMIPILPTNDAHLVQWIEGHLNGFLHIHGHYSDVDSLILHSNAYETGLVKQNWFAQLREFFKRRTVILIGHDPNHLNPLLVKMVNVLLLDDNMRNPPIFVSSTTNPLPPCFLHLPITEQEESYLHELLVCGPESSFVIGRTADKQIDKEILHSQAVLIFSEKQSFRKLGDVIYHLNKSGEIYVRRDALTVLFGNRIMYGNILTYGGSGLRCIWQLIIPTGSVFRSKGLVALGLQNSVLIWINKKPSNLGPITEVNTFHSLWNNSAAIMKTQAQTTSTTSLPLIPAPTRDSIPHLPQSLTTPPAITAQPLGISYPHHPLFPTVMSPQIFPTMSPTQVQRQLLTPSSTGSSIYQYYTVQSVGIPPLAKHHKSTSSRTASESSIQAFPTNDPIIESGDILDIDSTASRDSVSEGESNVTSDSCRLICMRAESPILLQELIQESLVESEMVINSYINHTTKIVATAKPSSLSIVTTGSHNRVVTASSTILQTPSQRLVKPVTQGLVTQVPVITTAPQRPRLIPLSPSMIPLATPTFQYPFTFTPYTILPSVIQSEQSRPQYYFKLLPSSNTVSTVTNVSSVIPFMTVTPTTLQQSTSTPSIINPFPLTTRTINPLLSQLSVSSSSAFPPSLSDSTKEAGSSSSNINPNTSPQETDESDNKSMHLWEFILHLLLTPNHGNIIQWTGESYEFTIIDPQSLLIMWADVSNYDQMNFNNLLGILRSYSGLGILEPVEGKKLTYIFVMDIQKYMSIYGHKIVDLTRSTQS